MKIRLIAVLLLLCSYSKSFSQKAFNGDSLLQVARSNAFANNYALAREQCDTVLNHYPDYSDVKILKARIYSWEKNYEASKAILEKLIAEKPDNLDAFKAICNNALWANQPEDAIESSEKGILIDPNNIELLLIKTKAQIKLKKYKEAEKTLATIRQIQANNEEAARLQDEIKILKRSNTISIYNLHDWFSEFYGQRNLLSLEYKRRTDIGPVLGRINYANRFGLTGFQYEADFYPRLSKNISGYLNYGFSNDKAIFPQHRFGAEVFYGFPKKITASLGIRFMKFTKTSLLTYTASGGIYTGKYWFGLRGYLTPTRQRTGGSAFLYARRYFNDDMNYFTVTIGQGVSPENTSNSLNFDSYFFLKSQTLKLQWVKTFASRYSFQLGTEFVRLQVPFDAQKRVLQFTLDTGIKYQF